ncbi:MAG: hypothetical protein ABEI86_08500 [Halobacteriaceae archaeon]
MRWWILLANTYVSVIQRIGSSQYKSESKYKYLVYIMQSWDELFTATNDQSITIEEIRDAISEYRNDDTT